MYHRQNEQNTGTRKLALANFIIWNRDIELIEKYVRAADLREELSEKLHQFENILRGNSGEHNGSLQYLLMDPSKETNGTTLKWDMNEQL